MDADFRATAEDCRIVRADGELDLLTAGELAAELLPRAGEVPRLVVDLTGVTFLDCSALREFCVAWRAAEARGGWLRLVYHQPSVSRILRATRLAEAFPRYASVADARLGLPVGSRGTVNS